MLVPKKLTSAQLQTIAATKVGITALSGGVRAMVENSGLILIKHEPKQLLLNIQFPGVSGYQRHQSRTVISRTSFNTVMTEKRQSGRTDM